MEANVGENFEEQEEVVDAEVSGVGNIVNSPRRSEAIFWSLVLIICILSTIIAAYKVTSEYSEEPLLTKVFYIRNHDRDLLDMQACVFFDANNFIVNGQAECLPPINLTDLTTQFTKAFTNAQELEELLTNNSFVAREGLLLWLSSYATMEFYQPAYDFVKYMKYNLDDHNDPYLFGLKRQKVSEKDLDAYMNEAGISVVEGMRMLSRQLYTMYAMKWIVWKGSSLIRYKSGMRQLCFRPLYSPRTAAQRWQPLRVPVHNDSLKKVARCGEKNPTAAATANKRTQAILSIRAEYLMHSSEGCSLTGIDPDLCPLQCHYRIIRKHCGCRPPLVRIGITQSYINSDGDRVYHLPSEFSEEHLRDCNLTDYANVPCFDAVQHKVADEEKDCVKHCIPNCKRTEWEFRERTVAEKTDLHGVVDSINSTVIEIYYRSFTYPVFESQPKLTFFGFMGDIGGVLGLYMGLSIFVIMHSILLPLRYLLFGKKDTNVKRHADTKNSEQDERDELKDVESSLQFSSASKKYLPVG